MNDNYFYFYYFQIFFLLSFLITNNNLNNNNNNNKNNNKLNNNLNNKINTKIIFKSLDSNGDTPLLLEILLFSFFSAGGVDEESKRVRLAALLKTIYILLQLKIQVIIVL